MTKIIFILFAAACLNGLATAQSSEELQQLYAQGRFDEVINNAANFLENAPNDPIINMVVGRAYADKMKFADAIPYLKTSVASDKSNSWPKAWALVYLGKCYFAGGKYTESENSINDCITLNATKNATQSALNAALLLGFDNSYSDWEKIETEHFVFHFQPMALKAIKDIDGYTKQRETAYRSVNEFFGCVLPKKIDFFVWHTRDDIKQALGSPGGFSRPEYCIVHACFDQTRGHEMTHVISNYLPDNSEKTVLINEGTAVYFDQTGRDQLSLAKKAIKDKSIVIVSLKEIWNNRTMPEEVLYPLGGAFIKYLNDTAGKEKFIALFKNQTYENARKVYGDDFERIVADFEKGLI